MLLALASAVLVLGGALSLVFFVLDGATPQDQEHRAQVWGTVFAILIVVPTSLAWAWRAVSPNPVTIPALTALPPVRTGRTARTVDLSGTWYTAWQSYKDGEEVVAVQPVRVTQYGERLLLEALERGRPVEDGGYMWAGELRLWDNETLMGWYASTDAAVRSKGTLYFALHPQGLRMAGFAGSGSRTTASHQRARLDDSH